MFAATDSSPAQANSFKALGISATDNNGVLKDNKAAKVVDQIGNSFESYKSKLDSAIDSTLKFVGTFDKFEIKSQSLSSTIRNMGKNFTTMRDYLSNMKLLESKGLAGGLMADLYNRGVGASGDVRKLAGATTEQIASINTTYADQEYLVK